MSPIHDQGYRRYAGGKAAGRAWIIIAWAGIKAMLAKRAFLFLLLAAWGPFLVRAIGAYASYAASAVPQSSFFRPTPESFRGLMGPDSFEGLLSFIITVYVGSGLIANDRRANALQIYLAKPMTRVEYIAGKLAILMTFLLLVTWAPAMMLLVVQTALAGNFIFVRDHAFLVPAITIFAFVETLTLSATMLALSSLSNSSRYVGILYTVTLFFSQAVYGVMFAVTRTSALSWVSVQASLTAVGDAIFRLPNKYDTPWYISGLVVFGLIGVSAAILERRVRGVEVIT
jgi:ABC-2 type transport system permease protein